MRAKRSRSPQKLPKPQIIRWQCVNPIKYQLFVSMTQMLIKFQLMRVRFRNLILLGMLGFGCLIFFMAYSLWFLWFSPQITLGLIAPLSGDFAVFAGKDMVAGAELAVEQANQGRGFLVGDRYYRVKLAIADDGNKPKVTIRAADQLLKNHAFRWLFPPKLIALISSPQSSLALPLAAHLQAFNVPLITAATDPMITQNNYVLGIGLDYNAQGSTLAAFARQTLKVQRAAILYDPDNPYSGHLVAAFQNTLEKLGGKVVIMATYRGNAVQNWGSQLQSIAQAKPDVLLLPNYLPDLISQGQELKKLAQQFNLKLPSLGGDSWAGLISANLPLMQGGFFLSPWHPLIPDRRNQQFVKDYTRAYRQPPRTNAALTYDAVQMILGAIANQKVASPEAVLRGTQEPFSGITGVISGSLGRSGVINQIKNGEAEFYQQIPPNPR